MEKYDLVLRPKLAQFRKFFQGTNLFYLVASLGALDMLISLLTYGIYGISNLAGPTQLLVLLLMSLADTGCATYGVICALNDGVKVVDQWKKELYIYGMFFIFFICSPASRIVLAFISLPLSSLGLTGSSMYVTWSSIIVFTVWAQTVATTLIFPFFVQQVTYLVKIVRDTTPGDKDLV